MSCRREVLAVGGLDFFGNVVLSKTPNFLQACGYRDTGLVAQGCG